MFSPIEAEIHTVQHQSSGSGHIASPADAPPDSLHSVPSSRKRKGSLVNRSGSLTLTDMPDNIRDPGITLLKDVASVPKIKDHIIFIMPHPVGNMYYFLRSCRSKVLEGTKYSKDIVILTSASVEEVDSICSWHPVSFKQTQAGLGL